MHQFASLMNSTANISQPNGFSNAGEHFSYHNARIGIVFLWAHLILLSIYLGAQAFTRFVSAGIDLCDICIYILSGAYHVSIVGLTSARVLDADTRSLWAQRYILGNAVLLGNIFCGTNNYGGSLAYEWVIFVGGAGATWNALHIDSGVMADKFVRVALRLQDGALITSAIWVFHAALHRNFLYRLDWERARQQNDPQRASMLSTLLGQPAWRTQVGANLIALVWFLIAISSTLVIHSIPFGEGYNHRHLVAGYTYFAPIALASLLFQLPAELEIPCLVEQIFMRGIYGLREHQAALAEYSLGFNLAGHCKSSSDFPRSWFIFRLKVSMGGLLIKAADDCLKVATIPLGVLRLVMKVAVLLGLALIFLFTVGYPVLSLIMLFYGVGKNIFAKGLGFIKGVAFFWWWIKYTFVGTYIKVVIPFLLFLLYNSTFLMGLGALFSPTTTAEERGAKAEAYSQKSDMFPHGSISAYIDLRCLLSNFDERAVSLIASELWEVPASDPRLAGDNPIAQRFAQAWARRLSRRFASTRTADSEVGDLANL